MKNMSDGINDGIVIMYCKNGTIYPVGLKQDQVEMLDISIGVALNDGIKIFKDNPVGQVTTLGKTNGK